MSININHTNNTFCSNSGVFIFGTGIVPIIERTVYSSNFSGKYYGDGSALTGLATGSFITTGMTGDFGGGNIDFSSYVTTGQTGVFVTTGQTGVFVTTGQTGVFVTTDQTGVFVLTSDTGAFVTSIFGLKDSSKNFELLLDVNSPSNTGSGSYNVILNSSSISIERFSNCNYIFGAVNSTLECFNENNFIFGSCCSKIACNSKNNFLVNGCRNTIDGYTNNNSIIGGKNNTIYFPASNSLILGGTGIIAASARTVYANNYCAYEGMFYGSVTGNHYGNGFGLTGIIAESPITYCKLIASGQGGDHLPENPAQNGTTNHTIMVAATSSYMYPAGYINLDCKVNENGVLVRNNPNLYAITNNANYMYTFNAVISAQGMITQNGLRPTSIKIEGAIFSGQVLNQVKTFYAQDSTDNLCVLVENGYLKLYYSGINNGYTTNKTWGGKLEVTASPIYMG